MKQGSVFGWSEWLTGDGKAREKTGVLGAGQGG